MLEHELELAAASAAQRNKAKLAERIAMLKAAIYRKQVEAYAACFLGPDGELTEAAQIVIHDLARKAGMGRADISESNDQLRAREAQRAMLLHMVEQCRLNPAKMRRLAARLREARTND